MGGGRRGTEERREAKGTRAPRGRRVTQGHVSALDLAPYLREEEEENEEKR